MDCQVVRDADRIIIELDYDSFELLPGTVNPRPGMKYIEDPSSLPSPNFIDPEQSEETLDFVTNGVFIEDMNNGVGVNGLVPYLLPISAPCWIVDNPQGDGKKKRKNKKKRHKNRQRQRKHQLQMDQPQDVSPPSPNISDGSSVDSLPNSPMKSQPSIERSPDQIGKHRRRGRGSRGRRLFSPNYIDYMGAHSRVNFGGPDRMMYNPPDPYMMTHQQSGFNSFPINLRTDLFW